MERLLLLYCLPPTPNTLCRKPPPPRIPISHPNCHACCAHLGSNRYLPRNRPLGHNRHGYPPSPTDIRPRHDMFLESSVQLS